MAPNPIMIPRKPVPTPATHVRQNPIRAGSSQATTALIAACLVAVLVFRVAWARRWFLSGATIESLLLLYSSGRPNPDSVFPCLPLWTKIATLNLAFAICSTSWLLYGVFAVACHTVALLTSLAYFPTFGYYFRRILRKTLGKYPQFGKDRLALFDLPALEIDTDVDGLLVVRGVTFHFSTLTIIVHGIEVGIKITRDIELAICVDQVTVSLFRRFEVGQVFANVKGGKFEMTFAGLDEDAVDDETISVDSIFLSDTPLLRAATAGSQGFEDRRAAQRQSLTTNNSYMKDSSPHEGLDNVTKLSPADELAENKYLEKLAEIRTTSSIFQSRRQAKKRFEGKDGAKLQDEKSLRAAISQELHIMPSIAHPPSRSVRVTTLQNSTPPFVRRFLHRLPFLLRLLLAPLGYFHSIHIESINAGGSGHWVSEILRQEVFKSYLDNSAELRRLHRRVSTWLENATFCLQLTDVKGLGSVPLSTAFDITAWLKFNDVIAYRAEQQSNVITQVVRLGGADATVTIPSYLLPHHEHLIPPKPSAQDIEELKSKVEKVDGIPKTTQAKKDLDMAEKDEASIALSVHASLPASVDQTLLDFTAALVKATKMIEFEKEVAGDETPPQALARASTDSLAQHTTTPTAAVLENNHDPLLTSPTRSSEDLPLNSSSASSSRTNLTEDGGAGGSKTTQMKLIARNIRQNLKDGTGIKEFAKNTKDSMRKAAVGGLVNDRWIAKLVGKTAVALQKAQGDVGYSGLIPIPLAPYRGDKSLPSKLLP
ncbi:hypothetical protein F5Y16DRAFT_378836 [Xylariaceae sp. FL0255]|nr:hypothetical protein F5Y16DRAFT_378836 [Xylariaceae sp. FL0255]